MLLIVSIHVACVVVISVPMRYQERRTLHIRRLTQTIDIAQYLKSPQLITIPQFSEV